MSDVGHSNFSSYSKVHLQLEVGRAFQQRREWALARNERQIDREATWTSYNAEKRFGKSTVDPERTFRAFASLTWLYYKGFQIFHGLRTRITLMQLGVSVSYLCMPKTDQHPEQIMDIFRDNSKRLGNYT